MSTSAGFTIEQRADEMNARFSEESLADHGRDLSHIFGLKDEADERAELLDVIGMLHKNMHNVRPPSSMYRDLPIEDLRKVYREYSASNEAYMTEYHAQQARTVTEFEAGIEKCMADHGINRETAIRWDIDARGLTEDVSHYGLEYYATECDLPFGYFAIPENDKNLRG
jgi:hypothetical protein